MGKPLAGDFYRLTLLRGHSAAISFNITIRLPSFLVSGEVQP